jgi:hypothetical protein
LPVDAETQKAIDDGIKAGIASIAAMLAPENLAKAITPILDAQNKAAGVLTKADLEKRDADAKAAADAKAKADADAAKAAEDAKKGEGKGKDPAPLPPEVLALQKQLEELTKTNAENARKAAEADAARKSDALHSATKEALAKAGIPADRIHLALPALKEAGVLVYDGERPGWKGTDPKTNTPAVLDMLDGVKGWIEGDGKHFLPPKDLGGTGDGAGNGNTSSHVASPIRDSSGKLDLDAALRRALS